jgi:hypothetical protein
VARMNWLESNRLLSITGSEISCHRQGRGVMIVLLFKARFLVLEVVVEVVLARHRCLKSSSVVKLHLFTRHLDRERKEYRYHTYIRYTRYSVRVS